jgi:16S rRNA (adenine1518-N6/adenine1519-N6)-dimethyltransferase
VIAALARLGLRPSRRLGQNFLVDPNLAGAIVTDAEIEDPDEVILEVGAGLGTLTRRLRELGNLVVAVELDRRLAGQLERRFGEDPGLRLVAGDALAGKHRLSPALLAALEEATAGFQRPYRLVANLPYAVAVPLWVLLLLASPAPRRLTATVQLEVAERLTARPGEPAYGAVSVLCQSLGRPLLRRRVPPEVFHPRPRVASAVVDCPVLSPAERAELPDPLVLREVLRCCFQHRRRQLRGALGRLWPGEPGAELEARAREAGIGLAQRPGEVPVAGFVTLARRLEEGRRASGDTGRGEDH